MKTSAQNFYLVLKRILCLGFLLSLVGCASLWKIENPVFSIKGVELGPMKSGVQQLFFLCEVYNPNDFKVYVDALEYRAIVQDQMLIEDNLSKSIQIPARHRKIIKVPVKFKIEDVLGVALMALGQNELRYQFIGSARFGWLSVPFDLKGTVKIEI